MSLDQIYETKSDFLKVENLNGQRVDVTIKEAAVEKVGDDNKIVLSFVEGSGKKLALNITNARMIAMLLGTEDHSNWVGTKITIKPDITTYQGKPTKCIRVESELPAQPSGQHYDNQPTQQRQQASDVPF